MLPSLLQRSPSRLIKYPSLLSPSRFKSPAEMDKFLHLLDSLKNLEGPSVEFLAESKWDYNDKGSNWSNLCPFGPTQSPIHINTEDTYSSSHYFLQRYYPLSLQYSPITTRGRFTKRVYILHGDYGKMLIHPPLESKPRVFDSVQFHFHSPSEHAIDSTSYSLEMHLVHKDLKKGTVNAVLGFMFKNTGKFNQFIQTAIDALEKPTEIDVSSLLTKEPKIFFYQGSLTTPPCTEGILWFLTSSIHECDENQLRFFTSRWDKNEEFAHGKGNNRELQPLYNRPIIFFDN